MRWPFVHLSWPLNPPKITKTKNNNTEKKWEKKKDKAKNKKWTFSVISQTVFCGGPKFPFFDNLAKKRAPKKSRGFSKAFLKNSSPSRNGHLWTKKTKSRNSSYHIFASFLPFQQQIAQTLAETPRFIMF